MTTPDRMLVVEWPDGAAGTVGGMRMPLVPDLEVAALQLKVAVEALPAMSRRDTTAWCEPLPTGSRAALTASRFSTRSSTGDDAAPGAGSPAPTAP